ncbi:hypothetical protein K435DRAFT_716253 [Dendrothele bispora CBS 962.96]|uniref:GCFC-domain-containing protein n=1 Tax=Dendrothele bispora (strain CBS 962.96) TaxID=1314807 RepID=A0A4S8MJV9_DENBC|nr:hypothetical protein K435DRAFT_716253 [Dendrothele bispora CBS 962.96]
MFNKRVRSKPSNRARPPSDNEDADTEDATSVAATSATDTGGESPLSAVKKFKEKTKKTKTKSRLSFGGDEEEESSKDVFQLKKSKLSRKLTLGQHPASLPENLEQANISSNKGPTYDQAYLNELKASTPSSRAPMPAAHDPYDADASMDMGDVSMESVDVFEPSETVIPTEFSIKMAKDRREQARKTGATSEEYISLSVTRRDEDQGPHPESRLVREEDELGEGEDEFAEYTSAQERIALGKKSRKVEASKRREVMMELIADAAEEDEETAEWEQEQLRRGGHRTPEPSSTAKVKQIYKPTPIPPATNIPSMGPALARLTQQLAQLSTSHASNVAALNSLAQERDQVDEREKEMRSLVAKAEEKRAWFGSFREWVEGVAEFLDEKYPMLEKLEDEYISLLRERFDMTSKRRQQDNEDDLALFFGSLPSSSSSTQDQPMEEIDEYGRTIPKPDPLSQQRERRTARIARRQLRQQHHRHQTHQPSQQRQREQEAEEGYSTDSSLPPADQNAYETAIASISTRKEEILSDVKAKEFLDPGKGQWGIWREKYEDSYVGAWGGLGVVSAWEFWARLELVGWDCIDDPKSLDSFKWYQGLYEYSRPGDPEDEVQERELGPDGDLVSSMITTAIVPRLAKVIEGGALDVYSDKQIKRAIDLTEEVEASVEEGNVKLHILLKSITSCFQKAITESSSPVQTLLQLSQSGSLPPPPFNPESVPARQRFLLRQAKLLTNLLRWRKSIGEKFGVGELVTRIVEGCVLPVAEGGWEVGGRDVVEMISGMLPNELVPKNVKTRLAMR